jgi:uncharacterized protein YecE (DUF72 family)
VAQRGEVRVGTSGWIYKHWRGVFYPKESSPRDWFRLYARAFDTVEINNSFYRLPSEDAFDAWRRQAPPGFVYALKASRYLTHMKKLKDPEPGLDLLLGRTRRLGAHLGPVLYQLPPHWRCNLDRLRDFLAGLPRDLRHVFEFRDPSWYTDAVRDLLAESGAGFCIHDMRGSEAPPWVTGPLVYVRFHGPAGQKYAGRYDRDDLRRWAEPIAGLSESGRDVYAYFNNDNAGHAVANALELKELLHLEPAAVGQ